MGWVAVSVACDSLPVGTLGAASAHGVLETLGEKMTDGPGYREGKNGQENRFLFPSVQEGRQRDRLNTGPGSGLRARACVNTTAWPLKEPSSAHCRDRQRETRRPHWLALKRSRAVADCRGSWRGLGRSPGSLALVPTACCGHQLMGLTQQGWTHRLPGLGTPRSSWEDTGNPGAEGPLGTARSSTQSASLPGRAEPLIPRRSRDEMREAVLSPESLAEVLGPPQALLRGEPLPTLTIGLWINLPGPGEVQVGQERDSFPERVKRPSCLFFSPPPTSQAFPAAIPTLPPEAPPGQRPPLY